MIQVNAVGDACPLPVIKTKKALSEMDEGRLEVLVDNEIAVQNIKRFAMSAGCDMQVMQDGGIYRLLIDKKAAVSSAKNTPQADCEKGPMVVVLPSDCMGHGDDELGRILMKSFVFSLTQSERIPDLILLYNSGVKLAVQDSASLADLKALETTGARIMACGTCLNHFQLADDLGVGTVTNMYSILEEMQRAKQILRP